LIILLLSLVRSRGVRSIVKQLETPASSDPGASRLLLQPRSEERAAGQLLLQPRNKETAGRIVLEPGAVLLRPIGSPPGRRADNLTNRSQADSRHSAPSAGNCSGGGESEVGARLSDPSHLSAVRTSNFGGSFAQSKQSLAAVLKFPKTDSRIPKSGSPVISSPRAELDGTKSDVRGGGLVPNRSLGLEGLTGGR
jgi:hypothetical protein